MSPGRVCPATGKVRYRDELAAKLVLARVDNQRRERAEVRAYRCRRCSGYHLTSSPPPA